MQSFVHCYSVSFCYQTMVCERFATTYCIVCAKRWRREDECIRVSFQE